MYMAATPKKIVEGGWTPETVTPSSSVLRTPPLSYVTASWRGDPGGGVTAAAQMTPQTAYISPREYVQATPAHPRTANGRRSVTPPPAIAPTVINETLPAAAGRASEDQWVSISTANMSPFTILRIKALIELSSICDDFPYNIYIRNQSSDSLLLRSRLKQRANNSPISVDAGDKAVSAQWWVAQLNDLIANAAAQPNRKSTLARINMQLAAEKAQLGIPNNDSDTIHAPTVGRSLTFNPGAALICFDPGEKPRRIRENHLKHFRNFLALQQQQPN